MTYKPIPTETKAGTKAAVVGDQHALEVLEQILLELRLLKTHAERITGEVLTESDLELEEPI